MRDLVLNLRELSIMVSSHSLMIVERIEEYQFDTMIDDTCSGFVTSIICNDESSLKLPNYFNLSNSW